MKKRTKIIIALLAVMLAISAAVTVYAVGYDSESDPLVALSYITDVFKPQVESIIQSAKKELSDMISALQASTNTLDASVKQADSDIDALESANAELKSELDKTKKDNENFQQKIEALESSVADVQDKVGADDSKPIYNFEVVHLTEGQVLMASDACEIILRSGSASAISPFAEQGLADYTAGCELLNGAPLVVNHLNLIPRGNDGRGLTVTSYDAYFMVRGGYTIVESQQ